ncbi:YncE family protein [Granulicella arctica]|uniref:YVTN family beta-propeller protein n=1 Tax=Granulicella arctica TaxID=940613 RepID=A0A7Y9PJV8_9BACT|nr:YVTN family beta-propeller protein [Granulicella arctica]
MTIPLSSCPPLRRLVATLPLCLLVAAAGCRRFAFPDVPAGYREFAYVSNGASNTVTVLDLVYLRQDRTLRVGNNPSGMDVNQTKQEVYVTNAQSGSVSIIDTAKNQVAATIPVGRLPYSLSVEPSGLRAFVANSGSNSVSVIDLNQRRVVQVAGTGEQPGVARVAPDARTLVVSNRGSGSVSIFNVAPDVGPGSGAPLSLRATFGGCPGATDVAILPDSSKAFVACSGGHQVMAVGLAVLPGSWAARHDTSLLADHFLTFLDVGKTPVHLAMKPDGGEIFVSNYASDSISEVSTSTNEVGGTYVIGNKPVHGIVSADNGTLWVSNFGADSVGIYSIDDGKLEGSVHTGSAPDVMAFSADEHLLLVADAHSGDVSVIRTQDKQGPALFTILPAGGSPNDIVVKAMQGKQ